MQWSSALETKAFRVFDGAMGSELIKRGLKAGGPVNAGYSELVQDVHKSYLEAGAHVILTNTLTANPIYYSQHYNSASWQEENLYGAELALETCGTRATVLGDMGPTGQMLPPFGTFSEEQFVEAYAQQAAILAKAGVHGFLVETMMDAQEAVCAVQGIRSVSQLPVVASLAFATTAKGCRTMMGHTAKQAVEALEESGVQGIGANCGDLTPIEMAYLVATLDELTDLPILVQPNAGRPHIQGEHTRYSMGPRDFAEGVMECVQQGAVFVGGCCGTTPEHIRTVSALLGRRG